MDHFDYLIGGFGHLQRLRARTRHNGSGLAQVQPHRHVFGFSGLVVQMITLLAYLLLYVALPYTAYRAVFHWTMLSPVSWAAAIAAIPTGVFLYVRIFERLKHGPRLARRHRDDRR